MLFFQDIDEMRSIVLEKGHGMSGPCNWYKVLTTDVNDDPEADIPNSADPMATKCRHNIYSLSLYLPMIYQTTLISRHLSDSQAKMPFAVFRFKNAIRRNT